MKARIIILGLISLFLLCGTGCDKESCCRGNVPYGECDCPELKKSDFNVTKKEAMLYLVSSEEEAWRLQAQMQDGSYIITYNHQTDVAQIFSTIDNFVNVFIICNFPDFAKRWAAPRIGQKVYFEGVTYDYCEEVHGIPEVGYSNYILTTLIKK